MTFKQFKRPKPGTQQRIIAPSVSINRAGLYLNRASLDLVGLEFIAVVLYYDEEEEKIGLWFWKNRESCNHAKDSYSITYYPKTGVGRISARSYIEKYELIKKTKEVGRKSFFLKLDKTDETKQNFYVAELNPSAAANPKYALAE